MTRAHIALVLGVLAATTGLVLADQPPVFKSNVDLVRLDVSVVRDGRPIPDLTARDFSIIDNGVTQRVNSVTVGDDLPVSVIMVLDISGSVAGEKLQHLIDASQGLLTVLRPDDRAALITFAEPVLARVPLTSDRSAIGRVLGGLAGLGSTSIRDAVWVALELRPADDSRTLVLVFTDGIDNASWLSESDILTAARRSRVVIHVVELSRQPDAFRPRSRRTTPPPTFVEELAGAAGGRRWSATSPRDLRELFTRAIDEMRARYLLTFYPAGVGRTGWHDLKVAVNKRGADVTARPGYFVPPRD